MKDVPPPHDNSWGFPKEGRVFPKKGREIFPKNQEMSENFGSICVRGGNGVPSPPRGAVMGSQVCPALRGGAVMGSQVCGAGRGRVLKLYVRGGNGVPVVTPCHSLVWRCGIMGRTFDPHKCGTNRR